MRPIVARLAGRLLFNVSYAALLLIAWEVLVRVFNVADYLLPRPSDVLRVLAAQSGLLSRHAVTTLVEIMTGFAIGSALGAALAVTIHLVEPLRRTLLPLLVALQSVPKVALAPLIIVWFGIGLSAKIIMVTFFCFFPVLMNMLGGLSRIEPTVLDLMGVLRARRWQTFRKVELPNALPALFDGLKIALPVAVIGAIVAEFTSAERGLGHLILVASNQIQTDMTFAALIVLTFMALLLFTAIALLERVSVPWSTAYRKGER